MDIMLDLETLSSAPDAAIVAIGATVFSTDGATSLVGSQTFYIPVDPVSAQTMGGTIDAATVQWWARQSPEARATLNDDRAAHIGDALHDFGEFVRQFDEPRIWGNGAGFDNVVLRRAYERSPLFAPWAFRADRCYRTLKNIHPHIPRPPFDGVQHNALADALNQARHAERIFEAMRSDDVRNPERAA